MKKGVVAVLILSLVFSLAGCASVQKKFTRKKKEKYQPSVIFLEETTYQKKYSNDYYYKTHFTMWRTWHDELIQQLGGNSKKLRRCAQETYNHLTEMNRYLTPEKQGELQPILNTVAQITKRIDNGTVSSSEIGTVRVELEKMRRLVTNDFYYDKVKDFLMPDVVDLGSAPAPAAPAATEAAPAE